MEHRPLIDEAAEIRAVRGRFPAFYAVATVDEALAMDALAIARAGVLLTVGAQSAFGGLPGLERSTSKMEEWFVMCRAAVRESVAFWQLDVQVREGIERGLFVVEA